MTLAQTQSGSRAKVWRPRQRAHWWLASVLVGCLLPATLAQADALRFAERLTQIYRMAPEAIRAESRSSVRKPIVHSRPQPRLPAPAASVYTPPIDVTTPALVAFSRRGPPTSA